MTTEKILILARAIPEKSQKYSNTVCVAGINNRLEWRRLYPFTFPQALSFHKRNILLAEVKSPDSKRDTRYESRKVIKYRLADKNQLPPHKVSGILQKIKNHSIQELKNKNASLGVITPQIHDIKIDIASTQIKNPQLKILWGRVPTIGQEEFKKLPVKVSYIFTCEEKTKCTCAKLPHNYRLIDWEVNELFRNLVKREGDNKKIIAEKMKKKFFDWMLNERDLYLILGKHNWYKTWMVIGIFYPQKAF